MSQQHPIGAENTLSSWDEKRGVDSRHAHYSPVSRQASLLCLVNFIDYEKYMLKPKEFFLLHSGNCDPSCCLCSSRRSELQLRSLASSGL